MLGVLLCSSCSAQPSSHSWHLTTSSGVLRAWRVAEGVAQLHCPIVTTQTMAIHCPHTIVRASLYLLVELAAELPGEVAKGVLQTQRDKMAEQRPPQLLVPLYKMQQ